MKQQLTKKSKLYTLWKQRLLLIIYLIIAANIGAIIIYEILIFIAKIKLPK
jgi:hypothetical protein